MMSVAILKKVSGNSSKSFAFSFTFKYYIRMTFSLLADNLETDETTSKKEALFQDFSVKSERIHTMNQLLKAYTLF